MKSKSQTTPSTDSPLTEKGKWIRFMTVHQCKYGNCILPGDISGRLDGTGFMCGWHWASVGQGWSDNEEEFVAWRIKNREQYDFDEGRHSIYFEDGVVWSAMQGAISIENLYEYAVNFAMKAKQEQDEAMTQFCLENNLNTPADHKAYCRRLKMPLDKPELREING